MPVITAACRAAGRLRGRFKRRRILGSIIRDAAERYPHPQDDFARARYMAERYFVASFDPEAAMADFRGMRHHNG